MTVIFERIAFYSLSGNLFVFLNGDPMGWMSYNAMNAFFVFIGISNMAALFGGWIADTHLGKFKTIVIYLIIYLAGYGLLPALHPYPNPHDPDPPPVAPWCGTNFENYTNISIPWHNLSDPSNIKSVSFFKMRDHIRPWIDINPSPVSPWEEQCVWAVYLALVVIAIGTSGVKANMSPFGAEQVQHRGPVITRVFFNWFYWCMSVGSLMALLPISYLQQEVSFFWGYVTPGIFLFLAFIVFLLGRTVYEVRSPGGSVITNVVRVVWQAAKRGCCCRTREQELHHSAENCVEDSVEDSVEDGVEDGVDCLDKAKEGHGGSYAESLVEDVKTLLKVACLFLTLIPYRMAYFQMGTTFLMQGLHMRIDIPKEDVNCSVPVDVPDRHGIPVAWLSLFNVVILILLIPFLDRLIYPRLDCRGIVISMRARIALGMMFAVGAMCVAGGIEMWRLSIYFKDDRENTCWQTIGKTKYRAADMSIMWQIPQYCLIALSEAFASIASLELAYTEAPRSIQGVIMGLFWFTQGMGALLSSVTIYWFHGVWFFNFDRGDINCYWKHIDHPDEAGDPDDPDHICHLDYYFFFLAGVVIIGLIMFLLVSVKLGVGQTKRTRSSANTDYPSTTSDLFSDT